MGPGGTSSLCLAPVYVADEAAKIRRVTESTRWQTTIRLSWIYYYAKSLADVVRDFNKWLRHSRFFKRLDRFEVGPHQELDLVVLDGQVVDGVMTMPTTAPSSRLIWNRH